jgi:hypothetical protein
MSDSENDIPPGAVCGCACECRRLLTVGNVMSEDVTDDPAAPWETSEPESPRVYLLLCAECYVGNHRTPHQASR